MTRSAGARLMLLAATAALPFAAGIRDSHDHEIFLSVVDMDGAHGTEATARAEALRQQAPEFDNFVTDVDLFGCEPLGFTPVGLDGPELIVGEILGDGVVPHNNKRAHIDDSSALIRPGDIITSVQKWGGDLVEGSAAKMKEALTTTMGKVLISFTRPREGTKEKAATATGPNSRSSSPGGSDSEIVSGSDSSVKPPDSSMKPQDSSESDSSMYGLKYSGSQDETFEFSIYQRAGTNLGFQPTFVAEGVSVNELATTGVIPDINELAARTGLRDPQVHDVKIGDIVTGVKTYGDPKNQGKITDVRLIPGDDSRAIWDAMTKPPPIGKDVVRIVVTARGTREKIQDVPGFPGFKKMWKNDRKQYVYRYFNTTKGPKGEFEGRWQNRDPSVVATHPGWTRQWKGHPHNRYVYHPPKGHSTFALPRTQASLLEAGSEMSSASKTDAADHDEAVDDPLRAR